jgi:hypothetical protein
VFRGEIAVRKELRPHFAFPPLSVIVSTVIEGSCDETDRAVVLPYRSATR